MTGCAVEGVAGTVQGPVAVAARNCIRRVPSGPLMKQVLVVAVRTEASRFSPSQVMIRPPSSVSILPAAS